MRAARFCASGRQDSTSWQSFSVLHFSAGLFKALSRGVGAGVLFTQFCSQIVAVVHSITVAVVQPLVLGGDFGGGGNGGGAGGKVGFGGVGVWDLGETSGGVGRRGGGSGFVFEGSGFGDGFGSGRLGIGSESSGIGNDNRGMGIENGGAVTGVVLG
jgi:hypothetical protein